MTYDPRPLSFTRLPPEEMQARARAFRAELARRRTVRSFSREPLPGGVLEECILAAASAPSGAHQQPWTFVVVTDAETKQRIREAAEIEERRNYDERLPRARHPPRPRRGDQAGARREPDVARALPARGDGRWEVERAVILADGELVEELGVPLAEPAPPPAADARLPATLDDAERHHIEVALRAHGGNILATARAIGVSRGLLYRKIARYNIVL